MTKNAKDLELKKHVGSIHCSNTLSLLQRKISNVLLYHAYDELLEKDEHEIAIKTLCQLIGYSSHDYETLKKALKALISTVLEWNLLGDSNHSMDDWNASTILASVGIKNGVCTYAYSNRLKKLLYMPEIYGRINIAIQSQFKSNYALALYENCIRYRNLPHTRWFCLNTFRKLMGVPETKYTVFRDFKRRVLDKSVQEINTYSDLLVMPEIEREGHQVKRLRFKLEAVDKHKQHVTDEGEGRVRDELLNFGFSQVQASKVLADYAPSFILEKIDLVKTSHAYQKDKVQNLAAYLRSALKEDYQSPKLPSAPSLRVSACWQQQHITLKKNYADYISLVIDDALEKLEGSIKQKLLTDFEAYLRFNNNHFVLDKYFAKGLSNRIVRSMYRNYIKEHFQQYIPPLLTFEDYQKTHMVKVNG